MMISTSTPKSSFLAENFDDAAAGTAGWRWASRYFYVDDDVVEILRGVSFMIGSTEIGMDSGLVADDSIAGCLWLCRLRLWAVGGGVGGWSWVTAEGGYSVPGGITISCVTFSSMGLT